MANYRRLKKLLGFYQVLIKTTRAIKLVTLSKLQKLQKSLKKKNYSLIPTKRYLQSEVQFEGLDTTIIPIATERSCCGPIDSSLTGTVLDFASELQYLNRSFLFHLLGKRSYNLIKKEFGSQLKGCYYNMKKHPLNFFLAAFLGDQLFTSNNFFFFFNRFYSILTQKPAVLSIPSFHLFEQVLINTIDESVLKYLLSKQDIDISFLKDFYGFHFSLVLLNVLRENFLSELGGRITAMDNAMKNLEELLVRVRIDFFKARQNSITNELIEIISCLNVLMITEFKDSIHSLYLIYKC